MDRARFYCEQLCEGTVELDGSESHHLVHVMRLQPGSEVEIFDGMGGVGRGVVGEIRRNGALVEVEGLERFEARRQGRVIIAASIAKGQRFDWLVTKCTELGADHIVPVLFERTVKLGKGSAYERYRKLTISAAKQCKRLFLPVISEPAGLAQSLDILKELYPGAVTLFGGFGDEADFLSNLDTKGTDVIAFVGPEGGMTDGEMRLLKEAQAREVCLNENVLRTETAAIAFAAMLCGRRGHG